MVGPYDLHDRELISFSYVLISPAPYLTT